MFGAGERACLPAGGSNAPTSFPRARDWLFLHVLFLAPFTNRCEAKLRLAGATLLQGKGYWGKPS